MIHLIKKGQLLAFFICAALSLAGCTKSDEKQQGNPPGDAGRGETASAAPASYSFEGTALPHAYTTLDLSIEVTGITFLDSRTAGYKDMHVQIQTYNTQPTSRTVPWKDIITVKNNKGEIIATGHQQWDGAHTSSPNFYPGPNSRIVYDIDYLISPRDFPVSVVFPGGETATVSKK